MARISMDRRHFIASVAAVGGGISLGWTIPAAAQTAVAGTTAPTDGGSEIGVWVVIKPDDTTIVRIARSEMGQGTFTGLAQLVADALDADWSKVRAEYVAPEVNLANKRAWGEMSTGGIRGTPAAIDNSGNGGPPAPKKLTSPRPPS